MGEVHRQALAHESLWGNRFEARDHEENEERKNREAPEFLRAALIPVIFWERKGLPTQKR